MRLISQETDGMEKVVYFAGAIRGDRSLAHIMREIVEFVRSHARSGG